MLNSKDMQLTSHETAMLIMRSELLVGALEETARTKSEYLKVRDEWHEAFFDSSEEETGRLDRLKWSKRESLIQAKNNITAQRVALRSLLDSIAERKLREQRVREAGSEAIASHPYSNLKIDITTPIGNPTTNTNETK